MLGCGNVLLFFVIMATMIGFVATRYPDRFRNIHVKVFDAMEDEIARNFGPGVSAADRSAFAEARGRFRRAWTASEIPPSAADRLRRRLIADTRKSRMEGADVRSLTDFLKGLTASRSRSAPSRPIPAGRAA
jgi:hypothetical protein